MGKIKKMDPAVSILNRHLCKNIYHLDLHKNRCHVVSRKNTLESLR